ncbi:porphobilinogen deaminase, putative [Talaromyces stipitatus ATCC 10500]|uniref:hydroxymethylbilane synthase n=1 Tax=Talaromyces stipitatus (strain ATCC 10500 / CBS 375.48 / QM 6759 / NRRL 1006) TaxID=441959 RepID=B8MVK7_TALSN|nr:porphobilinogen deaminase, putative [Talaromyces stipitatus ATCC 10500]EED11431.1 porphobilinogen deaminase, putative [Talaromyces stipitatus ATCC 10500]
MSSSLKLEGLSKASSPSDDAPAATVYPLGDEEQKSLTKAALSHINSMVHHINDHPDQPFRPPPECPASDVFKAVRVGSRNSKMALIQTSSVAAALYKAHHGFFTFPVSTHSVQGDRDKTSAFRDLAKAHGNKQTAADTAKSLWTLEIEARLLAGDIDLIVHSLKDVPTTLPDGCEIGAFPHRNDPTDALLVKAGLPYKSLEELPAGSVVGTCSVRRTAQLRHYCPHLIIQECRGNVDTRVAKLDANDSPYTAIVVAAAGIVRLNLEHRITQRLSGPAYTYAVGQGALGIEIRKEDQKARELVACIDHWPTRVRCLAERALLRFLQGGCSAPIGVHSAFVRTPAKGEPNVNDNHYEGTLYLTGTLLHPDGGMEIRAHEKGQVKCTADSETIGKSVGKKILDLGGAQILDIFKAM